MLGASYGASAAVRSQHLFVYGSLCAPEVMTAVTGLRMRAVHAELANHQVLSLRGQVYPGLTRAAGQHASGRVYRCVPQWALRRLDAFEGAWYERVRVTVRMHETASEQAIHAHTYRLHPAAVRRGSGPAWVFEQFMHTQCRRFARVWRARRRRLGPSRAVGL